ncbi:MAG: hypothetical protein JRI87_05040 [Deltaproteobacteria bacterium]|nr:hypothetical protein [Deltaproteobacteria bacterium]
MAAGAHVFDIYSGRVVPPDDINAEWLAGKSLTILYEDGRVNYSKSIKRHYCPEPGVPSRVERLSGERTNLDEDHEILRASRNGLPILCDEALSVQINKSGCYFPHILDAGEINFWIGECLRQDLRINVDPGQVYYLKAETKFGASVTMSIVPPDIAEEEILKCKLLTSDYDN